jgi:hypothetical protein
LHSLLLGLSTPNCSTLNFPTSNLFTCTFSTFSTSHPVPLHLGQSFHEDVRLRARRFVRQRLDQFDGVGEVVLDRLARRLEVDPADLVECRRGVWRALRDRTE